MLNICCDKCGGELVKPGALVFSPPIATHTDKYHLCAKCWDQIAVWLGLSEPTQQGEILDNN